MDSYDKLDSVWQEEDKFLELMITDGCFMLEIMRTKIEANPTPNHAENEPIFSTHWLRYIRPYIRRDMLLLENQLPMLVLYHLVAKDKNKEANECINETNNLILGFYGMHTKEMGERLHVMDVFRKGLLLPDPQKDQPEMNNCVRTILKFCFLEKCITGMKRCLWHVVDVSRKIRLKETENDEENEKIIRSATELKKTGIQFKKSPTHSLEDISFAGGVLKLPVIMVDGTTESKFLNLITFERLHGTGNEITSYIGFMDSIINNEHDVALLHTKGIIQNAMGSDKAVAKLFNALCQEVPVEFNRSICEVQEDISEYYRDPSNSSWAKFHDTYCSSPWARLSLFAAVFLFTLTIIQTVYAMLSYY
ncbi:hypothetical protein EUGRSUZ_J01737 [Eucalyptus grandis]|uniref:Uncharacterized protein n=2 Tax=Eucalyptus grandis TaxID=71139 RepID=A0A059AF81_EUCGR|nr:hypothetical protein EUGRSUZ_J01737 [Eucalyptus grandis]